MICPFCLHEKTEVYNSRPTKKLGNLWRRRRCLACHKSFTTREMIDTEKILNVAKPKGSSTTPFSKAKLILSLAKVLDHKKDNSPFLIFEAIEQKLIKIAAKNQHNTITKNTIVNTVLDCLKDYDAPGFVKYLSYHSNTLSGPEIRRRLKKS